jgi:hypothetical protein
MELENQELRDDSKSLYDLLNQYKRLRINVDQLIDDLENDEVIHGNKSIKSVY